MNRLAIAVATFFLLNRSTTLVQWILESQLPLPNLAIFLVTLLGGLMLFYSTVLQGSRFWRDYQTSLNLYAPAGLAGFALSLWQFMLPG
ncbi:hypothetical protein JOY44_26090 (plasmid) [Phormidium sp. CLA17]|uniref:hypothetical protein n=1 Tax=Leptolyngbya sp. Cla-17 TaxID=2803751 RepID=UPI0014931B97|nr:hypothetical protein [Leptolyngbya sp. Cla-17]MBM0744993.1 hypothetical protein [Leptolyngbya sp. Cla-17]